MCYQSRPFELFLNTRVLIRVWILHFNFQPVVYNRGECLPSSLAAHDWHQEFNCQVQTLPFISLQLKTVGLNYILPSLACSVLSKGLHFLLRAHDWPQDYHSQVRFFSSLLSIWTSPWHESLLRTHKWFSSTTFFHFSPALGVVVSVLDFKHYD
jgi:hypothetical protein